MQQAASNIITYLGTETQNPDPMIQADIGIGRTTAHRGLAYVVFDRLELAEFGNRIPNLTFEVEAQASATVATVIESLSSLANVPYLGRGAD